MPVVCVMPTTTSVVSTHPLFLAYTQGGPGHYDAVIMAEDTQEVDTGKPPENLKCNCGRKPDFKGEACVSIRCKCTRAQMGCEDEVREGSV